MTFRSRLLVIFVLTVVASVGLVTFAVLAATRRVFERIDDQRTAVLVQQFQREFQRRGAEVARRVEAIKSSDALEQMAIDLGRTSPPDYSRYVNEAGTLAHSLDFLELVAGDGTIISSAQWPARFGYKEDWVTHAIEPGPFLKREQLADEAALALVAVRPVIVGEQKIYVAGGQRLDKSFLGSLVLPAGMRVLLYTRFSPLIDASGSVAGADRLTPLIQQVQRQPREITQVISWAADPAAAETFHAIPLLGRQKDLLGVLLVGSSRRELVELERRIRLVGVFLGGAGMLLGVVMAWWATARVTRPVQCLAVGAREVAAGNWKARVDVRSADEIGELARAFNQMTLQLVEQRDRLVQSERVAAWRELARRLAHELKNPLFPLQITIENLQRARDQHPEQFEEVFRESTATLLAELANLKSIIARFSDFAKMPPPQLQSVDLNELVRSTMKLFEAQIRLHLSAEIHCDPNLPAIQADPEQLTRVLQNLVLNAMDAMPAGGRLTVRTSQHNDAVRLEVSDTGQGLTPEECERLFTPYYTTKQHGTGLGLAIVQSVISDHRGKISVESEPGKGTTFRIDLSKA